MSDDRDIRRDESETDRMWKELDPVLYHKMKRRDP